MTGWSGEAKARNITFDVHSVRGAWLSRPLIGKRGIHLWIATFFVHIQWTFLLAAALIAFSIGRSAGGIAIWILAVTVAVLVHEFGHAVAAVLQGGNAKIVLGAMGGLTFPLARVRTSWQREIWLSAAGPIVGMIFGGLIWSAFLRGNLLSLSPPLLGFFADLVWALVGWNLVNLLPVLPMDGGAIASVLFGRFGNRDRAYVRARVLSIWTGSLSAAVALRYQYVTAAIFLAALAFSNYLEIRDKVKLR